MTGGLRTGVEGLVEAYFATLPDSLQDHQAVVSIRRSGLSPRPSGKVMSMGVRTPEVALY